MEKNINPCSMKPNYKKRFGILAILIVLLIGQSLITNKINTHEYAFIKMKNVSACIPRRFIDDNNTKIIKNDYDFYLRSEDNHYIFMGLELSGVHQVDNGCQYIKNDSELGKLKDIYSNIEFINEMKNTLGLMKNISYDNCIEKGRWSVYYCNSIEIVDGKEYNAYIMYSKERGTKYMQICLVDETYSLTKEEMKQMRLQTGL